MFIAFFIPNSFFITPNAAIHGVYNNVKIIKLIADSIVNISATILSIFVFDKIVNVLNIDSLALIPVIHAVIIFQSLKPIGVNSGNIFLLIIANILLSSVTQHKLKSNDFKNQIIIDVKNIIVNDFDKKSLILFHIRCHVFFNDGIL